MPIVIDGAVYKYTITAEYVECECQRSHATTRGFRSYCLSGFCCEDISGSLSFVGLFSILENPEKVSKNTLRR